MTQENAAIVAKETCVTGIEGLDRILEGGLPRDCIYLLQGDPGSGKTTLALQFLLEGVRRGERGFYITLSETESELTRVARSHGWSLKSIPLLELSAIESLLQPEVQTTIFHAAEFELHKVTQLLLDAVRQHEPVRIVFDSLSEFRLLAETPLRYRRQLLLLKQAFAKAGCTVLLLDDKMESARVGADPHVLSLAHGVIEMEQHSPDYGKSRRRVRVLKMRGVRFCEGYHDYVIERGGLRVFPRLVAGEHHTAFSREQVRSGIEELDNLLGGGLARGTTTLILGQAGTGKSTLVLRYATQMAAHGERSMLFAFDESRSIAIERADQLGLKLSAHLNSGLITLQQIDPAEISPGEFAGRILKAVESGCKLVVIDSLNGYLNAMPGERYLFNQLHELAAYLNQQGVLTFFVMAQHGVVGVADSPVDLSYLADTVLSIRFFETAGEVKKAISVIKKRNGRHENTIREFQLDAARGIRVGAPLTAFRGVLTGVPTYEGEAGRILDSR